MDSFSPFRVVGSICADVPVSMTMLYGEPVLMIATGKTFQLYRGKALSMLRGGPSFQHHIRAVAQSGKFRFVAEGGMIHAFSHHKVLWTKPHNTVLSSAVTHLLAIDELLFSVGKDKRIAVWAVKTGDLLQEMLIENSETVSAIALPAGYTNKLLVATEEGAIQLFNFRKGTLLWHGQREEHASILSLAASSFQDIVAYGTSDGRVVVLNFGTNETVVTFSHPDAAVTALMFRSDRNSLLVSGTSLGEVAVWDLDNRCLDGVLTRSKQVRSRGDAMEFPHTDVVHTIMMAPGEECLLITAGADNALMQFRFDTVDQLGRLVRERRGHMGCCTAVSFYNSDLIVSAGEDRALRVTHVFSDRASWELSQGKLGRRGRKEQAGREAMKLPPATMLASSTTRNYQWSSLVAIHESSSMLSGWRMDNRCLDVKTSAISTTMHSARSVTISDCGNFAVVGYSSGNVAIINLQNKSIRHLFTSKEAQTAHSGSVECVEITCGNTIVVTAGLDNAIRLWNLSNGKLRATVSTPAPSSHSCVHQPSSLFIAAQHTAVRVYSCNPDALVSESSLQEPLRVFEGHSAAITAIAIVPDTHRYVVSASGDGVLLTWDLAAAACVGQYRVVAPIISLGFHPDALFMITAHAGERGTFLWTNNLRYGYVPEVIEAPTEVPIDAIPWLHYPTAHGEADDEDETRDEGKEANEGERNGADGEDENNKNSSGAGAGRDGERDVELFDPSSDVALLRRKQEQEQQAMLDAIPCEGLRLSGLPKSTWFNLTVLDQIKEKNQPILPPKKRDVPFFLPTTQELRPTFIVTLGGDDSNGAAGKSHVQQAVPSFSTDVQVLMLEEKYVEAMELLLKTNVFTLDVELKRVVDFADGAAYTEEEVSGMRDCLTALLRFVVYWLRRRENVDFVQGILANVLASHGVLLTKLGSGMAPVLDEVAAAQNDVRYEMEHLLGYPSTLASSFTGTLL